MNLPIFEPQNLGWSEDELVKVAKKTLKEADICSDFEFEEGYGSDEETHDHDFFLEALGGGPEGRVSLWNKMAKRCVPEPWEFEEFEYRPPREHRTPEMCVKCKKNQGSFQCINRMCRPCCTGCSRHPKLQSAPAALFYKSDHSLIFFDQ